MKTTILWGLVGLNVLLLGVFLSRFMRENTAEAQVAAGPGEYLLCPGSLTGISSEVVYVIDTLNGQMGAFSYDVNGNRLGTMPAVDLNRTFQPGAPVISPGAPRTGPGSPAAGTPQHR